MNDRYFGISEPETNLNLNFGIVVMTTGVGMTRAQLRLHRDIFSRKPLETDAHSFIDPRGKMDLIIANIDIVEQEVGR